ncbi:ABC transporter ATP-binding protein [Roseospirillum parvum]|uniref:ATP-binding cassette, subfamily B, MsbA n=1 Tax=Roseospirillum parvum TaxID=83401 RepID=A0A1G8EJK3_9PROT|nr:ABC transporter ATP-binding protein [Roseospirillum parvum]SDH70047.1 ATP-binding cassette, subfamily B, MsbA [Roseospirillum parvum]
MAAPLSTTRQVFGRLYDEAIRHHRGTIALAVFFMAIAAGCQALLAWLMEPVIDEVFAAKEASYLLPLAGAVLLTFMVRGGAEFSQSVLMNKVGLKIIRDMSGRLFAHLMRLDVSQVQATASGRLVAHFNIDVLNLRQATSTVITNIGKDLLAVIGLVAVMFEKDWLLACLTFFVFPLAVVPIVRLGRRMRRTVARSQEQSGHLSALVGQCLQGIRLVKSYRMEGHEAGRVNEKLETIYRLARKATTTRAMSSPIMETLGGVAVVVVILYGGNRVIAGETTTGAFFAFLFALLTAYRPMKSLANMNSVLQEGVASAQRLYNVLDTEPRITDQPGAVPLVVRQGEVRLDGVSFSYDGTSATLSGVDIIVPPGHMVALVGPSGAGKSTIFNLIARFHEVESGAVRIDGQDIREVSLDSLRQSVALVSQEVVLFDDTVAANIAFGRPGASRAEIEQAAERAAAAEFIAELPEGYDTLVGEQGMRLSGGQRQRIAIARALLKDAPILLLDEATSALDTESERHVQKALTTLMEGRTTLVIAHRLSTIRHADRIYVLDQGRVVEQGGHADLLAKGGAYARLNALQGSTGEDIG